MILASAIAATGAQAGVVLLTDPADGRLRCQCAEGFDADALARDARLRTVVPGEGVLGRGRRQRSRPARSGPVVRARPGAGATGAVLPVVPGGALRSPAASPALAATPACVGVLALYDRLGEDEFDDTDLRTVRTFADACRGRGRQRPAHTHEAQRLSHTDPLTGLYNYRHLKDLIAARDQPVASASGTRSA